MSGDKKRGLPACEQGMNYELIAPSQRALSLHLPVLSSAGENVSKLGNICAKGPLAKTKSMATNSRSNEHLIAIFGDLHPNWVSKITAKRQLIRTSEGKWQDLDAKLKTRNSTFPPVKSDRKYPFQFSQPRAYHGKLVSLWLRLGCFESCILYTVFFSF